MKASEIVKEVQHIIDTEGDMDVDISVIRQTEVTEQQYYLKAKVKFIVVESYEREQEPYGKEKRIIIRDWSH